MAAPSARRFLQTLWPPKPWLIMGIGLGITLVGLLLAAFGDPLAGVRLVVLLVGLLTAGVAVALRLKTAGQAFEERLESAGLVAVAAFAALIAYLGTDKAWDSMQMALVAAVAIALLGVVLLLLPTPARMIVVSVLAVVHFGGMITAANDMASPNAPAPWVAQSLHQWFYRPYLEFMYLNNAYHFYSPEPGPPSVVWFHIKYADGQVRWIKVPDRDTDPVPLHHMRLLSIAENISGSELQKNDDRMKEILRVRTDPGRNYGIPIAPENIKPATAQYQQPTIVVQKLIQSYARHVASAYPTLGSPDNTVKSIKVYRFRHKILQPWDVAENRDPLDPTAFDGYYEGEFDKDGQMLHPDLLDKQGNLITRQDPFLYWYIPIYYEPDRAKTDKTATDPGMRPEEMKLVDGLRRHAHVDLDKPSDKPPVDDPNDSPWTEGAEKSP